MPQFIDLTGDTYGRLIVEGIAIKTDRRNKWHCLCECGGRKVIRGGDLRSGKTKSCGCLSKESIIETFTTHDMTHSKEYRAWAGMIQRCCNPRNPRYPDYGGRGITVCQEWIDSFDEFFKHIGLSPSPKHSVDRSDNSQGYRPGNVRWATRSEQMHNQRLRNTKESIYKGVAKKGDRWRSYIYVTQMAIQSRYILVFMIRKKKPTKPYCIATGRLRAAT